MISDSMPNISSHNYCIITELNNFHGNFNIVTSTAAQLLAELQKKNTRALARSITHIENQTAVGRALIELMVGVPKKSTVIGVTGAPGAGKSTLVDQLIKHYRAQDLSIGIIAVDPSSPFTNGAILGDRIRMLNSTLDPNVYVRSMASRGHFGGLSGATYEVLNAMRIYGFDVIILETVGAGQSEIDIMNFCDVTLVVVVPGFGDGIQALKAGILEIADVFVLNKKDISGAEIVCNQLDSMLKLSKLPNPPPIVMISALLDDGVDTVIQTISQLPEIRQKKHAMIQKVLLQDFTQRMQKYLQTSVIFSDLTERVYNEQLSSIAAVDELFTVVTRDDAT